MQLLLATGNSHKLTELKLLLPVFLPSGGKIDYLGLRDANITLHEETGTTLEENARLKALAAARASGLISLSDDTGLEVDFLQGAPGVYTARYAGPACEAAANNQKLLQALQGVPMEQRTARFRTVACMAWPHGRTEIFEGVCPGRIAREYHGQNGFGYDPIFIVDELGKCFAELAANEKNAVSHRGRAFRKVTDFLLKL